MGGGLGWFEGNVRIPSITIERVEATKTKKKKKSQSGFAFFLLFLGKFFEEGDKWIEENKNGNEEKES